MRWCVVFGETNTGYPDHYVTDSRLNNRGEIQHFHSLTVAPMPLKYQLQIDAWVPR